MFAQFREQIVRCTAVIASQDLGVMDRGFLLCGEQIARPVVIDGGDFIFRQSFMPCDRKACVQSEEAVVFARHHQPRKLGDLAGHRAARFQHK